MLTKLIEQREEKEKLYNLVCNISGEDIREGTRRQEVVYSRIVFANILIDSNHSHNSIADFLGVHRTNIYHYLKTFPNTYHQSNFMKELYDESYEKFNDGVIENPLTHSHTEILKNKLIRLKVENKKLTDELKDVKVGYNEDIDVERFIDTFKAISINVKKGKEEILSRKIWNTIHTVNSSLT